MYEVIVACLVSTLLAIILSWVFCMKTMKNERKLSAKHFACMEFLQVTEKIFMERFDCYQKDKARLKNYLTQFNFSLDSLKTVVNEDGIGKAEEIKKFLEKELDRVQRADKYDNEVNQKSMELIMEKYDEMAAEEELTHDYNKKMQSPEYRERLVKSAVRKCWNDIYSNTGFSNEKADDVFESVIDNVLLFVDKRMQVNEETQKMQVEENKRLRNLINEFVHYIRES